MVITTTSFKLFSAICLDTVGPLPVTDSNIFIFTTHDSLTKYTVAQAIPNSQDNTGQVIIAQEFVEIFVSTFETPNAIFTDRRTNFTSEIFKEVCQLLKIEKTHSTTAYHPESNGALQRTYRPLKNCVDKDQNNWDTFLKFYIQHYAAYRIVRRITPYELVIGK